LRIKTGSSFSSAAFENTTTKEDKMSVKITRELVQNSEPEDIMAGNLHTTTPYPAHINNTISIALWNSARIYHFHKSNSVIPK
jgi:hypothetical protein